MFSRVAVRGIRDASGSISRVPLICTRGFADVKKTQFTPPKPAPTTKTTPPTSTHSDINWSAVRKTASSNLAPTKLYSVSGQYASALWSAAIASKSLDQVSKDLTQLREAYAAAPAFRKFLENPTHSPELKSQKLMHILDTVKAGEVTRRLFTVLGLRKRLAQTGNVLKDFNSLLKAHNKIVDVEVTTASPITEADLKKLENTIKTQRPFGEINPILHNVVNPSLIGGVQLSAGGLFVDMSYRTQLDKIHSAMERVVDNYFDQRKVSF